jgi:hypothetical protein
MLVIRWRSLWLTWLIRVIYEPGRPLGALAAPCHPLEPAPPVLGRIAGPLLVRRAAMCWR